MPINEYKCHGCGEKFEAFRAISASDTEVSCPKYGKTDPRRKLSSFISKNSSGTPGGAYFPT